MCDTLCYIGAAGTVFAKNSDRPVSEAQLIEAHSRRAGGGRLGTQYLEIPDPGAESLLISRPQWLWGAEHGVNEHAIAIGNEKVYTVADPYAAPPSLIGMDLVRLGLERGDTAEGALEVMTALLEEHGQGGIADARAREPYFSSFLIADPTSAWVLETAGRTWAAQPVDTSAAISNRLSLRTEWTRASEDVAPGSDFDAWRNPDAPTGPANSRLGASKTFLSAVSQTNPVPISTLARHVVSHLRDHGQGPWGEPGREGRVIAPPPYALPDGTGVSVCLHVRGYQATTSSMVALLPSDAEAPLRAWVALGSPCVSVYVPIFPPTSVPTQLGSPGLWHRLALLRDQVEADGTALVGVRAVLDPLESDLWDEADEIADEPDRWSAFAADSGSRFVDALAKVG